MKIYNKLIRDKIPHLMDKEGKSYQLRSLDENAYAEMLHKKLQEEIQEYEEAEDSCQIEELADIVEVIHAIVESKGVSVEQFEQIRLAKKEQRGGFAKKLLLISTE